MCKLKTVFLFMSLLFFFSSFSCLATDINTNENELTDILLLSIEAKSIVAQLKADSINKDQNLMQLSQKLSYYEQKIASFDQRYLDLENRLKQSEQLRAEALLELQDLKASLTELSSLHEDYKQKVEAKIRRLKFQRNLSMIITGFVLIFK